MMDYIRVSETDGTALMVERVEALRLFTPAGWNTTTPDYNGAHRGPDFDRADSGLYVPRHGR